MANKESNISGGVKKELRIEAGFVCPYPGCGSPFLTFHHFDPPRHVEDHNRPEGMIALCREHHGFADQGHYTNEQLKDWKSNPKGVSNSERQSLPWLRKDPIVVVGSIYTRFVPSLFRFRGHESLWLSRDDDGNVFLNMGMSTFTDNPMILLSDNCWAYDQLPVDVVCPPGGKRLKVSYETGDYVDLLFHTYDSQNDLEKQFPVLDVEKAQFFEIEFPIAVMTIKGNFGNGDLVLHPGKLQFRKDGKDVLMGNNFLMRSTGPIIRYDG